MPKDLKARLKRSHGAIGLLQALEEDVRKFVLGTQEREKAEQMKAGESLVHVNIEDVEDESDEEIVFVSKKMRYQIQRQESVKSFIEELATEKILFESLLSDPSASFGFVSLAPISRICQVFRLSSHDTCPREHETKRNIVSVRFLPRY